MVYENVIYKGGTTALCGPPVMKPTGPPVWRPTGPPVTRPAGPPVTRSAGPPVTRPAGPPVWRPTGPPVWRPTGPPVMKPTGPPVWRPTGPPVMKPTGPPVWRPTGPPVMKPTGPPVMKPTGPPVWRPTGPPVMKPTGPPVWRQTGPPIMKPTGPPVWKPIGPPVMKPTGPPVWRPTGPPVMMPSEPTEPPLWRPTGRPVTKPTGPPVKRPAGPSVTRPVGPPVTIPTEPPVTRPVEPPVTKPSGPPVTKPAGPPVTKPTGPPVRKPVGPPVTRPAEPPVWRPKPPDPNTALTVKELDSLRLLNGVTHHTDLFELMIREKDYGLIVRRGQHFTIVIRFNRPFDFEKDAVSFIFTLAGIDRPNYGQGSAVAVALLPTEYKATDQRWTAFVENHTGNQCRVKFYTSPGSLVGQWRMQVDTKSSGGSVTYVHPHYLYILFNPWCDKDDVYLPGDALCEEYVLLDAGLSWSGTYNNFGSSMWKYSQYEKDILDCSLYLITEIGKVRTVDRGNPIQVSRACTAAVNMNDDNGVLWGNWSTDMSGGTPPWQWLGSREILQTYYRTKKPVKYAQCWVFAGVLNTVCRAIGLPCRMVSNFESAHESQGSLTIDYFIDDKGNGIDNLNYDTIWNFHAWNEAWMKRPDLGDQYSGWQVIDSTPQEPSEGIYKCGPASVLAIKQGEIQKPYDSSFIYAEVNADEIFWKYVGPIQPLKLLGKNTFRVGKLISTKAIGKWEREDITHTYKYPEHTSEERFIMMKALKMSGSLFSRYYLNEEFNDVRFDFVLRHDIFIGEPFDVILNATNVSEKEHTVTGTLIVDVSHYNGRVSGRLKTSNFTRRIKPSSTDEFKLHVSFNEYFGQLIDQQCSFIIACMVKIMETNFDYYAKDVFRVKKPNIQISIKEALKLGQTVEVNIATRNSLPIPLKNAYFIVEGVGPQHVMSKLNKDIPPGQDASSTVRYAPVRPGRHTIAAKFFSQQLSGMDGFEEFIVQ